MKEKILLLFVILFFLFSPGAYSQQESKDYLSLQAGFKNPPNPARPKVYWWCLNGNIDTAIARREFMAMKKAGIGGFDMFEIGVPKEDSMVTPGPAFLSDQSLETIKFVVKEASKLGFEMGLNLASSWNAGGAWTLPENAGKSLYYSTTTLKGGADDQKLTLNFPEISFPKASLIGGSGKPMLPLLANGRPVYFKEVAVLAIPANTGKNNADTSDIINITGFFDPSTEVLNWKAPPGEWKILRYVCSNSGQQIVLPSLHSAGLTIDHFDSTAVTTHLMYIINKLKPLLGDFRKTALTSFYLASYEARGFVWTTTLPGEFKKVNGYDIYKFLPSLFDKELFNDEITKRVQTDFKKTLSELMINNLYKVSKRICNSYGLKINCEAGGPGYPLYNGPAEPLKALGSLDIPRGEFWVNHAGYYKDTNGRDSIDILRVVKEIAAAAHIYNKPVVEEESFTSFQHWQEGPFDLKPFGDRAFCEGMSRVVFHGFSHNPASYGFPGIVYHAGTHFNNKRIWWPMVNPFIDYLARNSFVFQNTQFVADVLYYYGDKVPNSATPKNTHFVAGAGYDYEVINTEVLLKGLTVKNGRLHLSNGAEFSMLALESEEVINPLVLTKLNELAQQGAIIIGKRPEKVGELKTHPYSGAKGQPLVAKLWTAGAVKFSAGLKGFIFQETEPSKILKELKVVPDFTYPDKELGLLDFIHYKNADTHFYFIRNTTDQWVSRQCGFRQKAGVPEIWNPLNGDIISIPVYTQQGDYQGIPLTLAPYGSYFVVFKKGVDAPHYTNISTSGSNPPAMEFTRHGIHFLGQGTYTLSGKGMAKQINNTPAVHVIDGPWKVSFTRGWGAPDSSVFPELMSWTNHSNKGIKYYSGLGTYDKTFVLAKALITGNQRIILDLGEISKVAEAWLNGKYLGISWAKPFSYDVTHLIRAGENELRIKVANVWSNRLTGDAITGEKFTMTNIKISSRGVTWANTALIPAGLLGPVTIQVVSTVK